jgi:hypothetical protein
MFGKKKEEKILEMVSIQIGIDLLQKQIEAAKQLMDSRPLTSADHASWNNKTRECLIRIYGEGSPNIDTITEASGADPVWLSMPNDVAERNEASCLEDKIKLLEGCVVALRRKDKEAGNS